jgi:hypothetical protein
MLTQRVGLLRVPFFPGSFGIRFSKLLDPAVEDLKAKGAVLISFINQVLLTDVLELIYGIAPTGSNAARVFSG